MSGQEMTLFPDEPANMIDYEEGWAVVAIDTEEKRIKYQGQNRNAHLEFVLGFEDDPDFFNEKVKGYVEEKEKIQGGLKRKYERNLITEEEATRPIVVTDYFPKEFFLEPKLENTDIGDF